VSGVIAATTNNGVGIAGVAPDASILPIRAFADTDSVSPTVLADALDRAADSGARVVNASVASEPMSWSWRETYTVQRLMDQVLAEHPSTLFVAAAGNGVVTGNDNDDVPVFPCSSDASNLVCVGASQPDGKPFYASNYGAASVDLFAPGVVIRTTTLGNGYSFETGTSFAAPFVSGEAALLFAKVPQLTPEEAISLILSTARYDPDFAGKSATTGTPDAGAALQSATADEDGDGVYNVVDRCPTQAFATSDGCYQAPLPPAATPQATPVPTATPKPEPVPRVRSLTAKVSRCKAGRTCRRSVTVRVKPDRAAKLSLRVERRVCSKRRCRWTRVLTKALSAGTRGATVVVRRAKGLPKGTYRVIAVPSSPAGTGKAVTRTFRVR
jgi:subtilisin family serine protease